MTSKPSTKKRPKIAVIHPQLRAGGSEARALWTIQALKDEYNVSLLTTGKVDIKSLNQYYGTSLTKKDFSFIKIPAPFFVHKKFDALRGSIVTRFCKKISHKFDLMINTYNLMDCGVKGVQCIADFSFDEKIHSQLDNIPPEQKKWYHQDNLLRRIYLWLCYQISKTSFKEAKKNITISNSKWSAELMSKHYGIKSSIIYPPVVGNFPITPYNQREDGFVCIGNIIPEKKIDKVVKILERVRKEGYDAHLHVVGSIVNKAYWRNLKKLCLNNQKWIFMEGKLVGKKKKRLIANHKFGISGRDNEPFGIAVAEMVKAGCIVFVPNGGGQVEIVNHPKLIYNGVEDAANKIEDVLKDNEIQINLKNHLAKQSQKFSIEQFMGEIRNVVKDFLIKG